MLSLMLACRPVATPPLVLIGAFSSGDTSVRR